MLNLVSFTIPGLETAIWTAAMIAIVSLLSGTFLNGMLYLLGILYDLFVNLVGADLNTEGTSSGDFFIDLVTTPSVQTIFMALLVVAVLILIVSVVVKTIKSEYNFQPGGNAKSKIIIDALKSLSLFVLVPIVCIMGVMLSNLFLGAIFKATTLLAYGGSSGGGAANGSVFMQMVTQFITTDTKTMFGTVFSDLGVWVDPLSNLLGVVLLWPLVKKIGGAAIGVFRRMYELTILFIVSSPITAIMPLTDGPYNSWKKEFMSRVLSMYGIIVSVNLCVALIGVVTQMKFFTTSDFSGSGGGFPMAFFAKYIAMLAGFLLIDDVAALLASLIGAKEGASEGLRMATEMSHMTAGALAKGVGVAGKVGAGATAGHQKLKDSKQANGKAEQSAAKKEVTKAKAAVKKAEKSGDRDKMSAASTKLKAATSRHEAANREVNKFKTEKSNNKQNLQDKEKYTDAMGQLDTARKKLTDAEKSKDPNEINKAQAEVDKAKANANNAFQTMKDNGVKTKGRLDTAHEKAINGGSIETATALVEEAKGKIKIPTISKSLKVKSEMAADKIKVMNEDIASDKAIIETKQKEKTKLLTEEKTAEREAKIAQCNNDIGVLEKGIGAKTANIGDATKRKQEIDTILETRIAQRKIQNKAIKTAIFAPAKAFSGYDDMMADEQFTKDRETVMGAYDTAHNDSIPFVESKSGTKKWAHTKASIDKAKAAKLEGEAAKLADDRHNATIAAQQEQTAAYNEAAEAAAKAQINAYNEAAEAQAKAAEDAATKQAESMAASIAAQQKQTAAYNKVAKAHKNETAAIRDQIEQVKKEAEAARKAAEEAAEAAKKAAEEKDKKP